jgi:hypothetical protein
MMLKLLKKREYFTVWGRGGCALSFFAWKELEMSYFVNFDNMEMIN